MFNHLSKYQKIAIGLLLPISMYTIYNIVGLVDIDNKLLDMFFCTAVYFAVPLVFVRASLPIVAAIEYFLENKDV